MVVVLSSKRILLRIKPAKCLKSSKERLLQKDLGQEVLQLIEKKSLQVRKFYLELLKEFSLVLQEFNQLSLVIIMISQDISQLDLLGTPILHQMEKKQILLSKTQVEEEEEFSSWSQNLTNQLQ